MILRLKDITTLNGLYNFMLYLLVDHAVLCLPLARQALAFLLATTSCVPFQLG
jgi:hypothetical protein